MNRNSWLSGLLVVLVAMAGLNLRAASAPVRLKLGTLAPAGTSYHKSLQSMGEKWRKVSNGAVQLVVFPGGTQGGEADMVGLMQTGNLVLTCNDTRYIVSCRPWHEMHLPLLVVLKIGRSWSVWPEVGPNLNE